LRWKVREKTLTELKELDAGSWFNERFHNEKIPILEEILDFLIPTGINIYAEIKETQDWEISDINNLINLIITKNCLNQCAVISFDANFLQQIRQQNLKITLGYLSKNITEYQEKLSYVKNESDLLVCHYKILLENPHLIQEHKNKGIKLIAWTIDDQENLNNLVELGLESIITNKLLP